MYQLSSIELNIPSLCMNKIYTGTVIDQGRPYLHCVSPDHEVSVFLDQIQDFEESYKKCKFRIITAKQIPDYLILTSKEKEQIKRGTHPHVVLSSDVIILLEEEKLDELLRNPSFYIADYPIDSERDFTFIYNNIEVIPEAQLIPVEKETPSKALFKITPTEQQENDIVQLIGLEKKLLAGEISQNSIDYDSIIIHRLYMDNGKKIIKKREKKTNPYKEVYEYEDKFYTSLEFIPKKRYASTGIIIANDVGMGKTILNLGIMMQDYETKSQLVIVPNRLIDQWKTSIENNTLMKVQTIQNVPQLKKLLGKFEIGKIYLMTYNVMTSINYTNMSVFSHDWNRIFMDEIHEIYNNGEMFYKIRIHLHEINRKNCLKVFITATPILDIDNMNYIASIFGENSNDGTELCSMFISNDDYAKWFSRIVFRSIDKRDKDLNIFPDPIITEITIPVSHIEESYNDRMTKLNKLMCQDFAQVLEEYPDLEIVKNLRKTCGCKGKKKLPCKYNVCTRTIHSYWILGQNFTTPSGAKYPPEKYWEHGSKYVAVMGKIKELMKTENIRLIVSSNNKKLLKTLHSDLDSEGIQNGVLEGTVFRINKIVNAYRTGEKPVLLIDINSQSSGLELTETTNILIIDRESDYKDTEKQLIGRACRTGQTKQVIVDILLLENSFEKFI